MRDFLRRGSTHLCYLSLWRFRLSLFFTLGLVATLSLLWVGDGLKQRLRQAEFSFWQQQKNLTQQSQALLSLQAILLAHSVKSLNYPTMQENCPAQFRLLILGEWLTWEQPADTSVLWRGEVKMTFTQLLNTLQALAGCALPLQKMVLHTEISGISGQFVVGYR